MIRFNGISEGFPKDDYKNKVIYDLKKTLEDKIVWN